MYRIDSADSVDGRFDDGDEALGREGTVVPADWLNAVQAELLATIDHADIEPDKADSTQLLQALLAIIAPAMPRTGELRIDDNPTPLAGWIYFNDGTIGPPGSGATTRANNDVRDLYFMYWNNYPNSLIPVSGSGRGANAESDWNAGKTLLLPRRVGRALAVAGNGAGLTNREAGTYTGTENQQLTVNQLPRFTPTANGGAGVVGGSGAEENYIRYSTDGDKTTLTFKRLVMNQIGGDLAHNNMQPTAFAHVRVKL